MFSVLLTCAAMLAPGDAPGPAWHHGSYRSALAAAEKADTLVMLVFLAEGSGYSQQLASETLTDERVLERLGGLIVFRPETGSRRGDELVQRYGVASFPTIVFARGDGGIEDAIYGFIPADPLLGELRRIVDRQGTVSAYIDAVQAAPEDLDARYQLASILGNLGAHDDAREHLDAIAELDPEGAHVVSARLDWSARKADAAVAAGSEDTNAWDLAPLYAHVAHARNAAFRHEARVDLGNMELARGADAAGFGQFRLAWDDVPASSARSYAFSVADFYLASARTDDGAPLPGLPDDSGAFALELARFARDAAVAEHAETVARLARGESDGDGDGDGEGDGDTNGDGDRDDRDGDSDGDDSGDSDGDTGSDSDSASDGDSAPRSVAEQRAGWDRWLARHHGLLARALAAEGQPERAAESMAAAVELDGDSAEYAALLAEFRAARR